MATYTTGKLGKVTVAATDLCVTEWEVDDDAEEVDTTCTDGTGRGSSITGTETCTINVKANFDLDASPFSDPPNIVPGALIALKCYVGDPALNKKWDFPTARVLNVKNQSGAKSLVKYEFTAKSIGNFTRPT